MIFMFLLLTGIDVQDIWTEKDSHGITVHGLLPGYISWLPWNIISSPNHTKYLWNEGIFINAICYFFCTRQSDEIQVLESKEIKYPIMYLASRKVAQRSEEEVSVLILPLLSSAFHKELHYFWVIMLSYVKRERAREDDLFVTSISSMYIKKGNSIQASFMVGWDDRNRHWEVVSSHFLCVKWEFYYFC